MGGQHPNQTTSHPKGETGDSQGHPDQRLGDDAGRSTIAQTVDRPIIFFDGDCVMCNGFVDLLLQIDSKELFYLSPLQGKTAQRYLPPLPHNREEWSIYYLDTDLDPDYLDPDYPDTAQSSTPLYSQSDAVIQICRRLGGIWSLVAVGNGIPSFVRDAVYRLVARNRYRLFGRRSTCRMPTAAERSRFLP